MRLIFLTDTHIKVSRPINRRDDFMGALFRKFTEIIALCRRLKVDLVIHGGDVFDHPRPEQRALDLFCWLLKELDLPVYCVAGNHDLIDQDLKSIDHTALGYLARIRRIRLLQPGKKTYLADGSCVIQLSGQHFHRGIDRRKNSQVYMVKKRRCDLAIHVVHGMLLPRAFSEKVPCTLISEVTATEADFTLGAHAHLGYHVTVGGKYFLNPGALARLTNLKRELIRVPQVLFMDLNADFSYGFIPLRDVRPGSEVMNNHPPEVVV